MQWLDHDRVCNECLKTVDTSVLFSCEVKGEVVHIAVCIPCLKEAIEFEAED